MLVSIIIIKKIDFKQSMLPVWQKGTNFTQNL